MNNKIRSLIPGLAALAVTAVTFSSPAQESFNMTNVINQGVNITSWPTNAVGTNLVITGYSTNGSGINTNGYYPSQQTGHALSLRNYDSVGFVFHGLIVATNSGNIIFKLVRAATSNPPQVLATNTGYPSVVFNDYDTSQTWSLSVPYATGTNYVTWTTNLEHYLIGNASHLGIYSVTNSGAAGQAYCTNAYAGLLKKIMPF